MNSIDLEGENCTFTIISVNPSEHIYLTVSHLAASDCDYGYNPIKIYNGEDANAPLIGEYCGNKAPPVISGGSAVHVVIEELSSRFIATYSVLDSRK